MDDEGEIVAMVVMKGVASEFKAGEDDVEGRVTTDEGGDMGGLSSRRGLRRKKFRVRGNTTSLYLKI